MTSECTPAFAPVAHTLSGSIVIRTCWYQKEPDSKKMYQLFVFSLNLQVVPLNEKNIAFIRLYVTTYLFNALGSIYVLTK